MWAALPDVEFSGIVFTMPDVLWPIFRNNRHLLDDLPALGAAVLENWAKDAYSARLMILVVRHTFGRHLNYNPHLHILVSAEGLRSLDQSWITGVHFDSSALMKRWRYALITYLREALRRGLIASDMPAHSLRKQFTTQYERWWSVNVQRCASKGHFLKYAGRYVRRPPLAQSRILSYSSEEVSFRTQDHKQKKEVVTRYAPEDFIDHLADHIPDHYKHGVRHFGLLSPRTRGLSFGAIFAQLGQVRRHKPHHLSWARSVEREYGKNPLVDSKGEIMTWRLRRSPQPKL